MCERCGAFCEVPHVRSRAAALSAVLRLPSYADAVALRESQATPILQQVRSDVTRYRYGDEQHLDEALLRIFRINKVRRGAHSVHLRRALRSWVLSLLWADPRLVASGATRRPC